MTHQKENAVFEAVTAILIEHGPAAMASAFGIIMNVAMEIEREQTLKAESHQRTAARQGYANGFKPKTINTRVGEVSLRIPQTRDYHDDQGRPFYPKSLERGVRSERAMALAVAEMYVQGVSTRKVTKIVEEFCGVPKRGFCAETRLGRPQRDRRRLGNPTVLPEHESQMTRQLIPAYTEEGLFCLFCPTP